MGKNKVLIGESLWINLANTQFLSSGVKKDILKDTDLMMNWLASNELTIPESEDKYVDFIEKLEELRGIINNIVTSIIKHQLLKENHVFLLNNFLSKIKTVNYLITDEHSLILEVKGSNPLEDNLYRIIKSMSNDLETGQLNKVRQCNSSECILYFIDKSKAGKRIWCDMSTCGNRKKASKHYYKKKQE